MHLILQEIAGWSEAATAKMPRIANKL